MKKIALVLVAGSLFLGTQSFAWDAYDQKIENTFRTFEQKGAFDTFSDAQKASLHDMVKNRVISLNLSADNVDHALIGGLLSAGMGVLKTLASKAFSALKSVGEKVLGGLTKLIGTKGTAIVSAIVGKVKGITTDQIADVVTNVGSQAVQDMAASEIAELATSAVKKVTGKDVPEEDKADAVAEATEATKDADKE